MKRARFVIGASLALLSGAAWAEPAPPAAPPSAAAGSAASTADAKPYAMTVTVAEGAVGKAATIDVSVVGQQGFKVNAEYPNRITDLRVEGAGSIKDAQVPGQIADKAVRFAVVATPTAQGTLTVNGTVRFSVCDDQICKLEKAPLKATVVAP